MLDRWAANSNCLGDKWAANSNGDAGEIIKIALAINIG